MNKKIFSILVSIFAVCGMIMTTGSASAAQVMGVDITSPTSTSQVYVKAGATTTINFTVTTDGTDFSGQILAQIIKSGTPITPPDETWFSFNFLSGTSTYPFSVTRTIIITTADGAYDVSVTATPPEAGINDTETGAVVVDNTAPTSTATIAKSAYNASAWDDASTINGTVSDGSGSGVKTITITIRDDTDNKYWDGDSWEETATNLSATLGVGTWTYTFDNINLTNGHNYTVTPTATDNLDTSAQGNSDSFIYDITPPAAFSVVSAITTGGNIVTGKWNNTNTGVNITVNIADDSSLSGGTIQIQAKVDSGDLQDLGGPVTITGINTNQTVLITDGQLEALDNFGNNKDITFTAIINDIAGNSTTASPSFPSLYVDQTPPATPVAANITVNQNAPGTNDTISGSNGAVEGYAIVEVWNDAINRDPTTNLINSGPADENGAFAEIDIGNNAYGTVWVTAKDSAGNRSDAISKDNDIVGPNAPSITLLDHINPTNEAAVTITGTGEANATVAWSVDDDANPSTTAITGTSIVNTEGNINITGINVSTLDDGTLTASVVLTDAAGNTGPAGTNTATKDTVNPTVVSVTPTQLNEASAAAPGTVTVIITFSEPMDETIDPTVTVQGLHSSYNVTAAEIQWSDGNTKWTGSFTFVDDNEEVNTAYYAISGVEDANGNEMADLAERTDANKLDVDTKVPAAATGLTFTAEGGTVVTNYVNTTNTNFTGEATITANEATDGYAEWLIDGNSFNPPINDTVIEAGNTSVTFDAKLSDNEAVQAQIAAGARTLTVKLCDAAGNCTTSTENKSITADYTAPTVNVTSPETDKAYKGGSVDLNFTASDTSSTTCSYKLDNGSAVEVEDCSLFTTEILGLTDGRHTFEVTATDAANNTTTTGIISFVVDLDDILTVGSANKDFTSIQAAVNAASSGDTINVAEGIYDEQVIINKNLTIEGEGGDKTKIIPNSSDTLTESLGNIAGVIMVDSTSSINIRNLSVSGEKITTAFDLDDDGEEDAIAGIAYYGGSGSITGVAASGFNKTESDGAGIVIINGDDHTSIEINTCLLLVNKFGIVLVGENLTATITESWINNNTIGIYVGTDNASNIHINSNDIKANGEYGVLNDGSATVDATKNWWGDVSGPGRADRGIGIGWGTGDAVSNNVAYDPWLDASIPNGKEISFGGLVMNTSTPTGTYTFNATKFNTEVIKSGTGTPTVTVAQYSNNPRSSFSGDIGKYIDVHISTSTDVGELEIRLYYTDAEIAGKNESSLKLYWWDGSNWSPCSDSGVNAASNYIWAKIRNDTTPNLSQLTGTVFGGGGSPLVTTGGGSTGGGGGSSGNIQTQVQNLIDNKNYEYACQLMNQWPSSFNQTEKERICQLAAQSKEKPSSEMTPTELEAKIAELRARIAELQAMIAQLSGKAKAYSGIPSSFKFAKTLKLGMTGEDVKYLQIMLNSDPDTKLALSGVGSLGNETTYFGPLTKAAIIKFQEKYKAEILTPQGLTSGTGLVANATRTKLNQLLGK